MIKQISEHAIKSLPGFWRIAKACMDGKYRKRDSTNSANSSRRSPSAPRAMTLEIIKSYTGTLSQFFTLSDVAIAEGQVRKEGEDQPVPPFVPAGTTVVAASHWASKIVEEVGDFTADLGMVDVSNEAGTLLKGMMDSLRWRFGEVLAATWTRGADMLSMKYGLD